MRVFKKVLVTVMATALVFTSVNFADLKDVQAAKVKSIKVKSGTKKTIKVGKSFKIKVKVKPSNVKLTYKSSSKKVASVSKKGKVKGVKPGKATITIKGTDGGKKAKVKVTVVPKKVTEVTVQTVDTAVGTAALTWKAQKNVTGYQIFASTSMGSGYAQVATVNGASTASATVSGLGGGTYYFIVKAYKKSGSTNLVGSGSDVVSANLWKLAWSDEFNGTSLDMNSWEFQTGAGGWGNYEYQNYTAGENVKVQNGNLVIIPRIEMNASNQVVNASSTRIQSKGKREFKYGKIEIRAKAAKATGTWSAGWMQGTNGLTWPNNGEIDIFESMNGGVPQTIHCPQFNNQPTAPGGNWNKNTGLTQAQSAADYHTYGIIWDNTKITFTVDGRVNSTYDPSKYRMIPLSKTWYCFKYPFYFILNCAIGGNAAGNVNTNGWTYVGTNGANKVYEDYMYVDYVRVYQQ